MMSRSHTLLIALLLSQILHAEVLFFEDFSEGGGSWHMLKTASGLDTSIDSTSGRKFRVTNPSTAPSLGILLKPEIYRDFTYSVSMRVESPFYFTVGICFGATGNLGGYYFGINRDGLGSGSHCSLFRLPPGGGQATRLAFLPVSTVDTGGVELAVSRTGPKIALFVNGFAVTTVNDPDTTLVSGMIGLFVPEKVTACYDDMLVTDEPRFPSTASCFTDSFDNGGLVGWSKGALTGTTVGIDSTGGDSKALRIAAPASSTDPVSIVYRSGHYDDFSMRTTVSYMEGDSDGGYGLVLTDVVQRKDKSYEYHNLIFIITADGRAGIAYIDSLDSIVLQPLPDTAIKGREDTLEVLFRDGRYVFQANGVFLLQISRPDSFAVDGIGFAVLPGVTARFDDFAAVRGDTLICPILSLRPRTIAYGETGRNHHFRGDLFSLTGRRVGGNWNGVRRNLPGGIYFTGGNAAGSRSTIAGGNRRNATVLSVR